MLRIRIASALCAARCVALSATAGFALRSFIPSMGDAGPTSLVFGTIAIAIYAFPAAAFAVAAWLLPRQRRDAAWLAVTLAAADAFLHIHNWAFNASASGGHVQVLVWIIVDCAVLLLVMTSWKAFATTPAAQS